MISHPRETERLKVFLSQQNLRWTAQRESLLNAFLQQPGHVSADELHRQTDAGRKIGFATVYRTLKHLVACGLAREVDMGDGRHHFENAVENTHHDHLLCVGCGSVEEFLNPRIEQLQEKVAQDHGYKITHHRLMLYGLCPKCRNKKGAPGKRLKTQKAIPRSSVQGFGHVHP